MEKNFYMPILVLKKYFFLIIAICSITSIQAQNCSFCEKTGWDHQKTFIIDNSSIIENLGDFPVEIKFNSEVLISAGDMLIDGSDIRVSRKCDGSLPLQFWFDDINTQVTKVWVKMDTVRIGVNDTIFVHYGNASALSESSANQVFTYHADFNTGDLSDWTFDPDGGTWALDTVDGERVMSCTNPPSNNGTVALLAGDLGVEDYIVEMEFYAQADGNMGGVVFEFDDFDNYTGYHLMTGADMTMSSIISNNTADYNLSESFVSEPQVWYDWSVVRDSDKDSLFVHLDGQLQRSMKSYFSSGIGMWAFGGGVIYYDNLFVRKFTKVPPVVTEYVLMVEANSTLTEGCGNVDVVLTGSGATSYSWDNAVIDGVDVNVSNTTLFTVTGTDDRGCKDTDTITIIVFNVEDPIISKSGVNNMVLTSSSAEGNQWYFNNELIVNAIDQSYTATEFGEYGVRVTEEECSSSMVTVLLSDPVGLNDFAAIQLDVFPNPVNDVISVSLTESMDFRIVDYLGNVKLSGDISSEQPTIDVETLSSGVYVLLLGEEMHSVKFVKE